MATRTLCALFLAFLQGAEGACSGSELMNPIGDWSVECVGLWLDNLDLGDLKERFLEKNVDGAALKELDHDKLQEDFGMAEEEQRKKIIWNVKTLKQQDDVGSGATVFFNTIFWLVPVGVIGYLLSLKYEKQFNRIKKKVNKVRAANKPKAPPSEGSLAALENEWLAQQSEDKKKKRSKSGKKG